VGEPHNRMEWEMAGLGNGKCGNRLAEEIGVKRKQEKRNMCSVTLVLLSLLEINLKTFVAWCLFIKNFNIRMYNSISFDIYVLFLKNMSSSVLSDIKIRGEAEYL
jgi:hypothetical protein